MSGISAQGSTLHIATGDGAAKNITDISVGFPAIVESVGHGFTNGTVVALADIGGTMAALNGKSHVVANATADTFALLDVNTTGLVYAAGGTATPSQYTKINGLLSFDGFDGAASDIDSTDLDSQAMEYISGLRDEGKFGFEIKVLAADNGQIALRAARTSGVVVGMKLTLPDGSVATFSTLVKSIPSSGAVNALLKGKVDTKISGPVVWS
ncbi:phage tail tube protein [Massilia sp. CT11-137]|uniref:phage tail tube protein n=1 Tax=Massilia sp. CT11-137 TaxID=3393901 RepID=UPI0039A61E13